MLYILTASNYVFGLASVPYLTRVLGAEWYGVVGFATAISTYFQLLLDFGFMLSATPKVAANSGDSEELSRIVGSVLQAKVLLIVFAVIVMGALCSVLEQFKAHSVLMFVYLAYVAVNTLIPDFLYRGVERMEVVTVRAVSIKAIFLVLVFVFVKGPQDYLLVPVFYLLGALLALFAVLVHMRKELGVFPVLVTSKEVLVSLKDSLFYFSSRIASTFYSSLNTVILGMMLSGSSTLGFYTAADKVIHAGKSASSPIADSLYPYMVRTKNFGLLAKIAVMGFLALVLACIPCAMFAAPICEFVFGEGYGAMAPILIALLPLIPITLPSYLFGFPALVPLGRGGIANATVILGAVLQVLQLLAIFMLGQFSVVNVCAITVVTELAVMLSRLVAFIYCWRLQHTMA